MFFNVKRLIQLAFFGRETFTLTTGVDISGNLVGSAGTTSTAGNDIFTAVINNNSTSNVYSDTFTGLDQIDGGAGNDTLTLNIVANGASGTAAVTALPSVTVSNIETMNVRTAVATTGDVSGYTGLTTLNVTQAAGDISMTAAATTNANFSGATGAITVKGGKDVVVTDATAAKAITVGDNTVAGGDAAGKITITDTNNTGANTISAFGGTDVTITTTADKASSGAITVGHATNGQASGAVVVTQNSTSNGTAMTAGDITVIGGSTVNITANMTNTAVKDGGAKDITAGAIAVTAGNTTTAVTVTQNATATDFANDAAALVKETSVVTFKAIKSGEALTINGLTFTAAKDLTADEAAAAFANLTAADTQTSGGKVANGIYTGTFNTAVWTSGAASGATVTFTATDDDEADLTFTGTAATNDAGARIPTQVKTAGAAAGASTAVDVTADYGVVTIDDNATASITTISVNGYANGSRIGTTTDTTLLSSLTLANAQTTASMTVDDTAATLALNVNGGMGTSTDGTEAVVTFTAAPTTLNVTATGNNYIDLTADATETLSVAGTGLLDIADIDLIALKTVTVTGSASLTLAAATSNTVTSIDTSGTTGTVTATIDSTVGTYTGGAGVDNVTFSNTTAATKAVNLGAGNDTLTLASGTTSLTSEMIGGDGTDTLVMVAADAVTASATTTFETKITGFEKLSLGAASATGTVNLANMDDISYVISANSAATAAVKEVFTADFSTSGTIVGADTIAFDGATITLAGGDTAANIATKVAAGNFTNYDVTVSGNVVTFTAKVAGTRNDAVVGDFTITDVDATTAAVSVTKDADGNGAGVYEKFTANFSTSGAIEDGDTIVFDGVTITLASGMTVAQIATAVAGQAYTNWSTINNGDGTVTFTNKVTDVNQVDTVAGDFAITNVQNTATRPAVAVSVTTQGAAAGTAATLTLDKMANNGTVELTAAGAGVNVTMTDATGTADTFNIVTKVNASDLNFGTVAVAGVETINITATDTSPVDANGNATISKATMTLSAAAAKSVVITGNSDLDLTAAGTSLTSVDGSAMTGKLTFTTAVNNAVIKGGSAADTLTANADDVTLTGNGGNDTLTVNAGADRAILTGGDGADKFVIAGASSTSSTYSNITALNTGDVIQFTGATAFAATKVTLSAGATETTQALMDLAVNNLAANGMGWFQTGGNTFIVMDAGADSTAGFVNGQDIVVMITGLVDLSTASYNSGSNTLEIA